MTNDTRGASGPGALFPLLQGHHASAIMGAAIELEVFGAIQAGAGDVTGIARAIGCPERTTRILVEALVALGVVVKDGGAYWNGPLATDWLVPSQPRYLGGMSNVFNSAMLRQAMSRLTDAVRAGGSVLPEHAETPRHPFWETFAKSTAAMSVPSALAIQAQLGPWLGRRKAPTLLDVAAGSGAYAYTLLRENSALRATLLDWPNVLVETRAGASAMGIAPSRLEYIEGSIFDVQFGGPYDVVLLSHIFHHFEPSVCESLLAKAARATAPDGRLVIHDFLTDGDNPAARMFSVTMLGWTKAGEAYASTDYRAWCERAGFPKVDVHPCGDLPTSIVIAAR